MAEIVLITGKPGAGKTAHVVHMMLNDPIFKNENGELRKVFTNIKGWCPEKCAIKNFPIKTASTLYDLGRANFNHRFVSSLPRT